MIKQYNIINRLLFLIFWLFSTSAFAAFTPLNEFGDNPGELTASYFATNNKQTNLVVLLHGCVQNGEKLATQSGFLALAKAHNFTLLLPQQNQNNNIKSCFNWFSEQDTNKNSGETLSIINMINTLKHRLGHQNIYIAGLSAGGAMTASLLVHYPDMFDAGAVIAGIPYPCANNLIKAISCMRTGPSQSVQDFVDLISSYNPDKTQYWPKLTVWTGTKDKVVHHSNSQRLAMSWAQLLLPNSTKEAIKRPGFQINQWKDEKEIVLVELIEIENSGHGMAINSNVKNGGVAADFLLESPLSAAVNIVNFWQINQKSKSETN